MKVTIITPYFEPEQTSATHLLGDLSRDLAQYGAEVTVVTCFPTRGVDYTTQREYLSRKDELLGEKLRIVRIGSRLKECKSIMLRGLIYLIKTAQLYFAASKTPADIFFIVSTPPSLGLIGSLLSRHTPTIYNVQDIFPDNLIAMGKMRNNSILYRLLSRVEQVIYLKNTHLITVSNEMEQIIISRNVAQDKVSSVSNWIDTSLVQPVLRSNNILFDQFALEHQKFYVSYAGNIGHMQNLQTLINVAEIMQEKCSDIVFVVIGDGSEKAHMLDILGHKGLKNFHVFPTQPLNLVSEVYALGDVEVVTLVKGGTKSAMPSKMWNIMSVAKPVICEADLGSELCNIIEKERIGVCVEPGDTTSFAHEVFELYTRRNELEAMGKRAREFAVNNVDRSISTKKYYDILLRVNETSGGKNV